MVTMYFYLFTLAVVAGNAAIVWHEVTVRTSDSAYDTWIGIIQGAGWIGLASAIWAFTFTEITENAMVSANWIRQRYLEPLKERQRAEWRAEGLEEGREEGRAAMKELVAEIKDWDQRRREAEARGEAFHEPPPYLQNGRD